MLVYVELRICKIYFARILGSIFLVPNIRQHGVLTPFSLFRAKCPNTLFALRGIFFYKNSLIFIFNNYKKVQISNQKLELFYFTFMYKYFIIILVFGLS